MQKQNRSKRSKSKTTPMRSMVLAIGALIMIFTVVTFLLLVKEPAAVNMIALAFLLVAELYLTVSTTIVTSNSKFKTNIFALAGIITSNIFYTVLNVILLVMAPAFSGNLNILMAMEVGALILAAIFNIAFWMLSGYVTEMNEKTKRNRQAGKYNKPKRGGF